MSDQVGIEVTAADAAIEVEGFVVVGPSPTGDHNHDHGDLAGLTDPDHPIAAVQGLQTALDGKEAAGTAASAVSAHAGAADPHTGYQKESEKAAANGYASLDATTKVPFAQLPTGTGASQVAIGNHAHAGLYDPAGTAASGDSAHVSAADPHTGYQKETEKGQANGYASLDGTGKVPAAQLPAASGGGHTIEDEGVALTQRTSLNFTGAGVTATDTGGKTVVTIPGGGGGGGTTVLPGSGLPTVATGASGDHYIRTTEQWKGFQRFGPRAATMSVATTRRQRYGEQYAMLTTAAHGLAAGDLVEVSGVGGTGYNGTFVVLRVPSSTTFVYRTSSGTTEADTADTGGIVSRAWGPPQLTRRIPSQAFYESVFQPSPAGWVMRNIYKPAAGVVLGEPWVTVGTASYIVGYNLSNATGASTTGEAYAFFTPNDIGSATTMWASTSITAPTEAGGEAGIVLGDGQSAQYGVEVLLKNDNKLYVQQNFYGSITNLYTSTTTAGNGSVALHKRGGVLEVAGTAWGCDFRTSLYSGFLGNVDIGVYIKNTTVGRVNITGNTFQIGG